MYKQAPSEVHRNLNLGKACWNSVERAAVQKDILGQLQLLYIGV